MSNPKNVDEMTAQLQAGAGAKQRVLTLAQNKLAATLVTLEAGGTVTTGQLDELVHIYHTVQTNKDRQMSDTWIKLIVRLMVLVAVGVFIHFRMYDLVGILVFAQLVGAVEALEKIAKK